VFDGPLNVSLVGSEQLLLQLSQSNQKRGHGLGLRSPRRLNREFLLSVHRVSLLAAPVNITLKYSLDGSGQPSHRSLPKLLQVDPNIEVLVLLLEQGFLELCRLLLDLLNLLPALVESLVHLRLLIFQLRSVPFNFFYKLDLCLHLRAS